MAIAYGFDYIQPLEIPYYQSGALEPVTIRNLRLEDTLIGMGFTQVMNSYLTNENANYLKMGLTPATKEAVSIANSVNSSVSMVRTWILPSLMMDLGKSQHAKMPHKLFELDMAFSVKAGKPVEEYKLAAVVSDPKANLNDIRAAVEELVYLNRIEIKVARCRHESFIEGRCGEIIINGVSAGFFGEIHPKVLKEFSIEEPVAAFEINLGSIIGNNR